MSSNVAADRRREGEEGVILVLLTFILMMAAVTAYFFVDISMVEIHSTYQRATRAKADLLAKSGVELAKRAILDDLFYSEDPLTIELESNLDPWALLSQTEIEVAGDGTLRVSIQDAGNRINLNALFDPTGTAQPESADFLTAVLEKLIDDLPGRTEEKFYKIEELVEGIIDWIDWDEETRLGDDEEDYYKGKKARGVPLNRPIFALQELDGIPGLDDALMTSLQAHFTTQPLFPKQDEGGVNPNTAPPHVLALLFHGSSGDKRLLDRDEVFRILKAREEDGRVFCPSTLNDACESLPEVLGRVGQDTIFPPVAYTTEVFTVKSVARFGETKSCIFTVLDRQDPSDMQTLLYRMGC